jgi:hypothetical protein
LTNTHWFWNIEMTDAELKRFADDVLEILVEFSSQNGRDAISHVMSEMYSRGWKKLGPLSKFEEIVKAAGFTLDHRTYKNEPWKRGNILVKTYITV